MKNSRFIVTLVATLALTGVTIAAEPVDYRLPVGIHPGEQAIELYLDPAVEDYRGNTTITLSVAERTERIGIYQLGLEMTDIELSGNGVVRKLEATDGDWDMSWLADGKPIDAGEYELKIRFSGAFATDSLGMHRTAFEGNDYIFTQFESVYARRAFPVFDEPAFKIPFQLTINAPAGLTVVSNTPVAERTETDGWQRVAFMQTRPLPSYLIAYSVGPLDRAEIKGLSVPGYIYAPKGRAGELGFVLRETPKVVAALEEYFGFDYPYKKLDFLAVPEFAFGAMENPGLITFRTDLLMLGDEASGQTAMTAVMVVAHEVAHIWYGDLVTMEWWNDLWLNEAFATWMSMSIMEQVYPQYETNLRLPQSRAFPVDQRTTSKAIRRTVRDEEEIIEGMGLNYTKGHGILNMLEAYVGPEVFREAIQAYVRKYAWTNATEKDLWNVIGATSNLDIAAIASDFLNQPGFASLRIEDDGAITQKRYLTYGRKAADLQWKIPLNIKYKKDGEIKQTFYLLQDKTGVIDIPAGSDWVFPDVGGNGYFRWNVGSEKLYNLVDDAEALSNREKIALLSNSEALLNAGDLTLADYLFVLNRMLDDPHPLVFLPALENLKEIGDQFIDETNRDLFAHFVDQALSERFESVGTATKATDSEALLQMRPRLMRVLGEYGTDPAVRVAAASTARKYLAAPESVSSDLGREALRVVALSDDGSLYADYKQAYLHSQSEDLKSNILASIYFKDPQIVRSHLDFSISDAVPAGDSRRGIQFYAATLDDHAILYAWLGENLEAFRRKLPSVYHPLLPKIFQSGCSRHNLDLLREFFQHRDEQYSAALAEVSEAMEGCIARRAREGAALNRFLTQFAD